MAHGSARRGSVLGRPFEQKFFQRCMSRKSFICVTTKVTDYSSADGFARSRLICARRDFCSSVRFFAL
jgi:hypothetical protein